MIVQNLILASESYTHSDWVYRNVCVEFSRLYYIIDGEGYYEENGNKVRFKPGYLYLTPVRKSFDLYENPNNKLLHTYSHITTLPAVSKLIEIEVKEGTPLADGVALWRKYVRTHDEELIMNTIRFLLSCLDLDHKNGVADRTKQYLDGLSSFSLDMAHLSRVLGYGREHIIRSFVAEYHVTPKQYFNTRRMNLSLERLLSGAKVGEVALDFGYSTPYSFSKAFKNHFGLSPEKYLATLGHEGAFRKLQ